MHGRGGHRIRYADKHSAPQRDPARPAQPVLSRWPATTQLPWVRTALAFQVVRFAAKLSRTWPVGTAHCAGYASRAQRLRGHRWHGLPMNTTRELAQIIAAADQLPEPARTAARSALWQVQRLSPAAQVEAVARWHAAMSTWPAAM